jgi:hypothetical protein
LGRHLQLEVRVAVETDRSTGANMAVQSQGRIAPTLPVSGTPSLCTSTHDVQPLRTALHECDELISTHGEALRGLLLKAKRVAIGQADSLSFQLEQMLYELDCLQNGVNVLAERCGCAADYKALAA